MIVYYKSHDLLEMSMANRTMMLSIQYIIEAEMDRGEWNGMECNGREWKGEGVNYIW